MAFKLDRCVALSEVQAVTPKDVIIKMEQGGTVIKSLKQGDDFVLIENANDPDDATAFAKGRYNCATRMAVARYSARKRAN